MTTKTDVRAQGECVYCGDRGGPFTVDHVVPVCRGGSDTPDNWCCCCSSCSAENGETFTC